MTETELFRTVHQLLLDDIQSGRSEDAYRNTRRIVALAPRLPMSLSDARSRVDGRPHQETRP